MAKAILGYHHMPRPAQEIAQQGQQGRQVFGMRQPVGIEGHGFLGGVAQEALDGGAGVADGFIEQHDAVRGVFDHRAETSFAGAPRHFRPLPDIGVAEGDCGGAQDVLLDRAPDPVGMAVVEADEPPQGLTVARQATRSKLVEAGGPPERLLDLDRQHQERTDGLRLQGGAFALGKLPHQARDGRAGGQGGMPAGTPGVIGHVLQGGIVDLREGGGGAPFVPLAHERRAGGRVGVIFEDVRPVGRDRPAQRRQRRADGFLQIISRQELRQGVGRGLQQAVALAQFRLGALAVGDILHGAQHADRLSVPVQQERAVVGDPAVRAVAAGKAILDRVGSAGIHGLAQPVECIRPILGVNARRPGVDIDGGERLGILTREGRNGAGPLDPPGRAVVVVDHLAGRQGDDAVPFLAGLQLGGARRHQPFRPLPLSNEREQVEGRQQGQQSAGGWNPAIGKIVVAGNERRTRRDLNAPDAIGQVKVPVEMPICRRRGLKIGRGGVIVQPALLAVGSQIQQAEHQLPRFARSKRVAHHIADADHAQYKATQPRSAFLHLRFRHRAIVDRSKHQDGEALNGGRLLHQDVTASSGQLAAVAGLRQRRAPRRVRWTGSEAQSGGVASTGFQVVDREIFGAVGGGRQPAFGVALGKLEALQPVLARCGLVSGSLVLRHARQPLQRPEGVLFQDGGHEVVKLLPADGSDAFEKVPNGIEILQAALNRRDDALRLFCRGAVKIAGQIVLAALAPLHEQTIGQGQTYQNHQGGGAPGGSAPLRGGGAFGSGPEVRLTEQQRQSHQSQRCHQGLAGAARRGGNVLPDRRSEQHGRLTGPVREQFIHQ